MNSSCQILPGIKKLYWVERRYLQKRIDLYAMASQQVAILCDLNEIIFSGDPDCRCVTSKENNGWHQESTLKFRTAHAIPCADIAFIVTDVSGQSYLIGAYEMPYPLIKWEYKSGTPSGDPAGFEYEITHNALRTLVKCVI